MTSLPIDAIFNGIDDDETETVDLPLAYLRFLSSLPVPGVGWLDNNYNPDQISSNQQAILEDGLARVAAGANQMYDTSRVAQLYSLTMMFPGLVAFWPGYPVGSQVADVGPLGLHLNGSGTYAFIDSADMPVLLTLSAMGESSYWSLSSSSLDITGVESNMSNPGITLMTWVLCEHQGYANRHFAHRVVSGVGYQGYLSTTGRPFLGVNAVGLLGDVLSEGWRHVACTWVPGYRMAVFGDGQLVGELLTGVPGSITSGTRTFFTGNSTVGGGVHQGATAVCRSPLSDAAIMRHYIATRGLYE